MATFKLRANPLTGQTLTLFLAAPGGSVANGSGDAMTESSGLFSATVAESLVGVYDYWVRDTDSDVVWIGQVYCSTASVWIADQLPEIYPPVERDVSDTRAIEFYWKATGATFANSASTCKRRFSGETGAQEEALSGAITAVSGVSGLYKLAYNIADRAADATTIVPTEVTYRLVDDNGNSGDLTLRITTTSGGATEEKQDAIIALLTGGSTTSSSPVTPTGTINDIVIGDDYRTASGRSFIWYSAVPAFSRTGAKCYFGGFAKHKGQWLVDGTITEATIDSVPKWKLEFELDAADTATCLPGCYEWSVELRGPAPEQITKVLGTTELIEAYTR